ncbi:MAG: hypothetical protein M1814_006528 [Vezdaea aestivalis]|nr:MAG: hypothetical protein M1814_006528 [Vezdaea aestivalis]
MATSPPSSPSGLPQRPMSAVVRAPRSQSRMSLSSRHGANSRASDEDGKTSVKVAVRVRPPLRASDPGFDLIPQRFQRSMLNVNSPTSLTVESPQGRKLFVFDKVFSESVDQEGVWEYLSESVNAFVQGYNVSLLAYGQSGAGKSYTMGTSGPDEQNNCRIMGVIPRAAIALFDKLGANPRGSLSGLKTPTRFSTSTPAAFNKPAERNWVLKATYVEIYNEQLRDLLVPESTPANERNNVTIREDTKGRILLTGLHTVIINSIDDLLGALNFGSTIRQTDATAINAKSSRSHAVFSLNLVQRKNKLQSTTPQEKRFSVPLEAMTGAESWVTVDSKLHFVDLAGSERLKNTGAQGDRAREGISINAGLASLGKVISQLSSRSAGSHVSYRDSKLTRLLQDSLGGNAITYMIACVTPAEFHLSETLNTVQYAQRARAIQSKPRIQQVADEGDKQALIERLRAEVAFLREQIRNAERTERRSNAPQERAERQNEREMDLQNQLLDIQENYSALSQRHAKLISEMAKPRNTDDSEEDSSEEPEDDSAMERLKRSNSFAEAVKHVVLEYEKTIQSLETSLSSTRSSLSTTESSLLEKETKFAYIETVNQQLQTRVQKLMDREASNENYLHDLEEKLDGHTSGEEKNGAIALELRKEITRIRESEANAEDYISTLEERLAEAEQDTELMQREIDRLEHVVERQRSLGKLDNLLYELDHIQQGDKKEESEEATLNGDKSTTHEGSVGDSIVGKRSINGTISEETEEDDSEESDGQATPETENEPENKNLVKPSVEKEYPPQSPAQSKFVADKLESVTQELFDLKVDHEGTLNEFDLLSAKYEEALRTLAELQDVVDESRQPVRDSVTSAVSTRPTSFLGDARVNEIKDGEHVPSSRSLSSELFSAGQSPDMETLENGQVYRHSDLSRDETIRAELQLLQRLHSEKEESMIALTEQYARLQDVHQETLDEVEELKTAVSKAKMSGPVSPGAPVIRRKSSQNVMMVDKAHRSFASLRNIGAENFEDRPDVMQNFELNLNSAMHELHTRSERVQELEADIASVKKEMETKMTIISGLTRERSSMKNQSPMDLSVVASMRDQLVQSENQMRMLSAGHERREKELLGQIGSLQKSRAVDEDSDDERDQSQKKVVELQKELAHWEKRHQSAIDSMQASEKQLLGTISELEGKMKDVEQLHQQKSAELTSRGLDSDDALQKERMGHDILVASLQQQVNDHKAAADNHSSRISELEEAHNQARKQITADAESRKVIESQLSAHRLTVAKLEHQITSHKSAFASKEDGLKELHETHSRELNSLRTTNEKHTHNIRELEDELANAKGELEALLHGAGAAMNEKVYASNIQTQVQAVVEERDEARKKVQTLREQLNLAKVDFGKNQSTISELEKMNNELVKEMEKLHAQNEKNRRLVDDLEDQLSANYDQHLATNNRLSTMEAERIKIAEVHAKNKKAENEIAELQAQIARLEAKTRDGDNSDSEGGRQRSNSASSNLRKSNSVAALPSPPPAIPLPPLPNAHPGSAGLPPAPPTPTGSRHPSRDMAGGSASAQLSDDQEARIRTIEKHLFAEKQLTSTLEEALADLETQGKKTMEELDSWKRRASNLDEELKALKTSQKQSRVSMQAVEEERNARKRAEAAQAQLEERMHQINKNSKKKKGTLNCF